MAFLDHSPIEQDETSDIVLRLDRYGDIFSDFDVRPYSKRALSVDFLEEVKRAARDKSDGKTELILLMPEKQRNEHEELIIKERLAEHFKKHHGLLLNEKRRVKKVGAEMVALGVLCLLAATVALFKNSSQNFLLSFLVVLLEPAAWFLLWEGMDQIVFTSRNANSELDFYHKMSTAHEHISFKSY